MSRSIHTTENEYQRELYYQYSDKKINKSKLLEIRQSIHDKKMIKRRIRLERKLNRMPFDLTVPVHSESIPIEFKDGGEFTHYLVLKNDIIGVINNLPAGILNGLSSILFCPGKEYQQENTDDQSDDLYDPYIKRKSIEIINGVYASPISGTYLPDSCQIHIYAYVYDRKSLIHRLIEPYLRFQILTTLLHEIAHHDDNMRRSGHGRWMGLNKWKCEDYADSKQEEWAKHIIVPYLLNTYPEEYNDLSEWIQRHGGVAVPLSILAHQQAFFSASSAVETLFENVLSGKAEQEIRFEFANDLHYSDHYDEALIALDDIIMGNPDHSDAIGLKSDIFIHLEEYDKAEITARQCLDIDPGNTDALLVLCNVYLKRQNWSALTAIASRGIEVSSEEARRKKFFIEYKIISSLYTEKFHEAKKDTELLSGKGMLMQRKTAFDALVLLVSGEATIAYSIAKKALDKDRIVTPVKAILKSVANHASSILNKDDKMLVLNENEKRYLKSYRIANLVGIT